MFQEPPPKYLWLEINLDNIPFYNISFICKEFPELKKEILFRYHPIIEQIKQDHKLKLLYKSYQDTLSSYDSFPKYNRNRLSRNKYILKAKETNPSF